MIDDKPLAVVAAVMLTLSPINAAGAETMADRPACKELEALYAELGERAGEPPSEAEIQAAIYDENPTNADCRAMLALFAMQGGVVPPVTE